MARSLPTLGALLQHLLNVLDEDVLAFYRAIGLDYRPRFTPVVRFIVENGPSSIRSIASGTALTHSAASQTVAELVKHGLARRTAGKTDARERVVQLTPKARAMLPLLQECWGATNAVVADLDRSLGCDVSLVLRRAIEELEKESFFDRLAARLELPARVRARGAR
jgi:DNA-binding MarR family transcriptional regulator